MKAFALPPAVLLAICLAACGQPVKPPPDAGVDSSCGLDCAAQERFGLVIGRCFEYSTKSTAANPAELGALVGKVFNLEGGLSALPVEYRQSGQIQMTDYFAIKGGDLYLARRSFLTSSVTYYDDSNAISGAKWLAANAQSGESFSSEVAAQVTYGQLRMEPTSYRMNTLAPSAEELTVPMKKFDSGLRLIPSETPDHGADTSRVFVSGVGFVRLSTYFSPDVSGTARAYRLQRIRDMPDAGVGDCSLGTP